MRIFVKEKGKIKIDFRGKSASAVREHLQDAEKYAIILNRYTYRRSVRRGTAAPDEIGGIRV
jgi:hypothetical protein